MIDESVADSKQYRKFFYMTTKYNPVTLEELKTLVSLPDVNLADIDTSQITSMEKLFCNSIRRDFSGIENWNTSMVKSMKSLLRI